MLMKYIYVANDETEFSSKQDCLDYEEFCKKFIDINPKLMSYSSRDFLKDGRLTHKFDNIVSLEEIPNIWKKFLQVTVEFVERFLPSSVKLIKEDLDIISEPTWENFGKYPIELFKEAGPSKFNEWPCVLSAYHNISSLDPKTGDLYFNRYFHEIDLTRLCLY
jgi:hypothetical protein